MAVSYANEQKWNDFLKAHGIRVLEADRWAGEHMMSWSDFAHHHPLGSMAHDDYLPLFADFFRSRSPGARRMTNAQIARLMRQHKQANPYIRDQDDSRAKAEAAYERADRAYTKAVLTYGGFDVRTVAAYRRRQKAEQALHAILRRNPKSGTLAYSSKFVHPRYHSYHAEGPDVVIPPEVLADKVKLAKLLQSEGLLDTEAQVLGVVHEGGRVFVTLGKPKSLPSYWHSIVLTRKQSNPTPKRTQLASLNRRIAAAERAGMPVAYLMEQRDLLLLKRGKKRNPGDYEQRLAEAEQNRGQLFRSLRGKTKQELLGILSQQYRIHGMSAKDSITDLKYAITSAAFPDPRRPRRNPGKYVFGGHDFTEETYPKSLFPWEVAYTKTLAGMPEAGIPDMPVDESLAFIDERSARQWAESPRVLKAGYRPYAIRRRNPGLTPAGKKHLIQTMHKAGADTFRKKVAYVRRHIPNVTDPQAFVGYVMAGERKGKRR